MAVQRLGGRHLRQLSKPAHGMNCIVLHVLVLQQEEGVLQHSGSKWQACKQNTTPRGV